MDNDILFLLGFIGIDFGFLLLFPFYIGLNFAVNRHVVFSDVSLVPIYSWKWRYVISGLAVVLFSFALFSLGQPLIALIVGFIAIACFVVKDYLNMYKSDQGAPRDPGQDYVD